MKIAVLVFRPFHGYNRSKRVHQTVDVLFTKRIIEYFIQRVVVGISGLGVGAAANGRR